MNLITDHIDLWTSTVKAKSSAGRGGGKKRELYGIKKLRELILKLAIRGLLIPQCPSDEPATKLLEQITKERENLLKAGKIKKHKTAANLGFKQEAEEVPKGWIQAQFGDVLFNRDAERDPLSVSERKGREGEYDYYGASGVIDKIDDYIFDCPLLLIGEDGANLINRSTPIAFIAEGKYWVNNHAHVLDALNQELLEYVCLYINAISLEPYITGIAQPKMNQAKMNSILLSIPPLAEQHRIVAKVDELMGLCDKLEQQTEDHIETHETLVKTLLDTLTTASDPAQFQQAWQHIESNFDLLFTTESSIDHLKQTILQLAVMGKLVPQDPNDEPASQLLKRITTEKAQLVKEKKIKKQKALPDITESDRPFETPISWKWVNFYEIIESLKYGTSKKCYEIKEGNPVLRIPNIQNGRLSSDNLKYTTFSDKEIHDLSLRTTDILIVRSNGSLDLVGRTAIVSESFEGYCYAGYLVRARTVQSHFNVNLLQILFSSPLVRKQIEVPIRHGVGLKNINSTEISQIKIPIPPLAEQKRIVAKVEELMTLCDTLKAKITTSQTTQLTLTDSIVKIT